MGDVYLRCDWCSRDVHERHETQIQGYRFVACSDLCLFVVVASLSDQPIEISLREAAA
jgi:hypothetical protein